MSFDRNALTALVLLAVTARPTRVRTLADVAESVGARRADVRATLTRLHVEGFVDGLRVRPTLAGLALATALRACMPRMLRAGRAIAAA
jgi:hypothetical protein